MTAEHETMTAERIAELQKICDAATPGPWTQCSFDSGDGPTVVTYRETDQYRIKVANAAFIAAARTALPDTLATIASLQAALAVAREGLDEALCCIDEAEYVESFSRVQAAMKRCDAALKGAHPTQGGE